MPTKQIGKHVKYFNGTSWVTISSGDELSGNSTLSPTSAFSPSGDLYVAFGDLASEYRAVVMKYDGTEWDVVGSRWFSEDRADGISLAFNAEGEPYVAFADGKNENRATVMKYNGTAWTTVGTAGFSVGGVAQNIKLAFNPTTNEPYLAYRNGATGKAMVMKFTDTDAIHAISATASSNEGGTVTGGGDYNGGETVTLTATANAGYHFARWTENGDQISSDNPYIFTAGMNRTVVAEFELTTSISDINQTKITAVYPNPANDRLFLELKENAQVSVVNMLGTTITTRSLNAGENVLNISELENGIYFLQTENGGAVKFVKE